MSNVQNENFRNFTVDCVILFQDKINVFVLREMLEGMRYDMHFMGKAVFGVSPQVRHKPDCTATDL